MKKEETKITEIVTTKVLKKSGTSISIIISPWELDLLNLDRGDAVRVTLRRTDA